MTEKSRGGKSKQLNLLFLKDLETDELLLRRELQRNPKKVFLGPQYHIKTSGGEPVDVNVVYYDSFFPERRLRHYLLFGVQPQLGIVARKNSTINFRKDSVVAGGRLVTGYRGKGYGTVMELVQVDILQREANKNGEITWEINDQSYESLYAAERDNSKSSNNFTQLRLKVAKAEHDKWESIYNRFEGEFHPDPYKPKYFVRFKPEKERGAVGDLMRDVILERRGKKAIPIKSEFYQSESEKEKTRIGKINQLLGLISIKK